MSIGRSLSKSIGSKDAASASDAAPGQSTLAFKPIAPRDAETGMSWHLGMIGDVQTVWQEFTGKGVSVGVYDSGTQKAHWDLDDNYDASNHVVIDGKTYEGDYNPASGRHGTSVSGIIAAERNGAGTVGVAHQATLTGVDIFNPYSGGGLDPGIFVNAQVPSLFYRAIAASDRFDVVNHSWGGEEFFDFFSSRSNSNSFAASIVRGIERSAEIGRDGLGTVHVAAAGNRPQDGQSDPFKTDRHVVTVSAFRESDGSATGYTAHGAHLFISAPSDELSWVGGSRGVVTTDLLGRDGANTEAKPGGAMDHTDTFGGTSAATPMVTGVVALMLDANEGLGWRDVKEVLSQSARMPIAFETGPTVAVTPYKDQPLNNSRFKLSGEASDWNGGARHYSTDYGFGAVDAHAAVRMAEVWSLFGPAKTSRNEQRVQVSAAPELKLESGTLPEIEREGFAGTPAEIEFTIGENISAEHIDMTLGYTAEWGFGGGRAIGFLRYKIIAPDGTEVFGFTDNGRVIFSDEVVSSSFTLGFAGFRGVETAGTWKVQFEQAQEWGSDAKITIHDVKLDIFGATVSANDVHSYTDEFFTMAAIAGEGGRRTLSDTDGGVDWINAAAVTADVELSLVEGATTRFGGRDAFAVAAGSLIENAVTGDGNDRLIGNALDNRLYGMRGDDWLNGGAGNDTLFGGRGSDVFAFDTAGVSGNDRVLDWSAGDRIATSKMLRGADQNGVLTVGSSALLLLDGTARGDTAELAGRGGATLQALGKSDGYWWYGFLTEGDEDFVDGRVTELALGQTGRPAGDLSMNDADVGAASLAGTDGAGFAMKDTAFFLYNTMADTMASGVQTVA